MSTSLALARRTFRVVLLASVFVVLCTPVLTAQDAGVTTIRLTEDVLVEDTMRLGVNLGGRARQSQDAPRDDLIKREAILHAVDSLQRTRLSTLRYVFGPASGSRSVVRRSDLPRITKPAGVSCRSAST